MLYLYCILFFIYNPIFANAEISDLRKCADPFCKIKIAEGRTTQRYLPKVKDILGCKIDEKVVIYSKEAGTNPELWGIEINGRRGYFPSKFIKEEKVYEKDLSHIVSTTSSDTETNVGDKLGAQESKMDNGLVPTIETSTHEEPTLDSVLLSPEDAEIDSIKSFVVEEKPPSDVSHEKEEQDEAKASAHEELALDSVLPSLEDAAEENPPSDVSREEGKEDEEKEEMKITITRSAQTNNNQPNINNEAEGQTVESVNTEEPKIQAQNQVTSDIEEEVQKKNSELESKEKNEIKTEKVNLEIKNEKINLEIKTDESKSEEMDNDEGNGNEGEDNGSEIVLEGSFDKEDLKEFSIHGESMKKVQNEVDSSASGESLKAEEQNEDAIKVKEAEIAASTSTEKSGKINTGGSSTLERDKITPEEKISESPVNEKSQSKPELVKPILSQPVNEVPQSKPELAKPTPPQYQLVDGTQIPLEDSDIYQSEPSPEVSNTHSHFLEGSSKVRDSPTTEKTMPISKLPGIPLTEPPLLLKKKLNKIKSTEPVKLKLPPRELLNDVNNVENPEVLAENTESASDESASVDEHDILNSAGDKQILFTDEEGSSEDKADTARSNHDTDHMGFSAPKQETILEDNRIKDIESTDASQDQTENIVSESQIEDNFGQKIKIESTPSHEQMESTEGPENQIESNESPESQMKNIDIPESQIESNESPSSQMQFINVLESQIESSDESESSPTAGDGILSSLSNTLNSLTGDTNKEDYTNQKHDHEDQHLVMENKDFSNQEGTMLGDKEDLTNQEGTVSESMKDLDNKQETIDDQRSDKLIENLPFVDPEINPLQELEPADSEPSPNESKDHIHTDETEENEVHSFKKKLLHASESVYQWVTHIWKMNEGMVLALEGELADPHLSTGTVTFLLVVAGTIIILYLSHMIMVKMSRESPLLEMMNKLDRNQRVLTEENNNLKRQLTDTNGQIKSYVDPVALQKLRQQFEFNKQKLIEEVEELRERNQQLETDLEASTANEVELHRMLDELLSNQRETTNFEDSVNSLQSMLDGQREIVEGLTADLSLKTRLNEELRNELKANKSKLSKLEYQIEQLTQSLEEVNTTKHDLMKKFSEEERNAISLKEMNDTLRQEVDKASKDSQNHYKETQKLLQEIRKLKQKVHNKEAECRISKECLKKLQILTDGGGNDIQGKLAEIFKVIEVKTQLTSIQHERDSLQTKLEDTEKIIISQTEDLKNIQYENSHLRETSSTLQKERENAVSKLEVLSKYYEERETQLKKALESQEGLLQSAEGSATVVSNRIHTYELELESCRSQIESLKNELEEQKQSYKVQLANEEKKLHETWLTARAAERRQEELRQENSQLRQSLTHLQRDSDHKNMFTKLPPKRVDANGSVSSPIPMENNVANMHPGLPPLDMDGTLPPLPPMMFPGRPPLPHPPPGLPPLPHHLFGPLPPPPPMPPDRRLPPAGRIASPPPGYDRRSYSPESDRSRYSDHRYSPGPSRYSPNNHRGHSPERRSDHMRRNITLRRNQRSPSPSLRRGQRSPSPLDSRQRHSPREQWYNHSPQGLSKNHRSPPLNYYDSVHENRTSSGKGKKTSTPLGPNDR